MNYCEFAEFLLKEKKLQSIDFYLADFAVRMMKEERNSPLFLLTALISGACSLGREICLPAEKIASPEALRGYLALAEDFSLPVTGDWLPETLPEFLVFQNGNYYLQGNFQLETDIRNFVLSRISQDEKNGEFDPSLTSLVLTGGQVETVKKSQNNPFLIISGGPGTGKTTILATILALREEAPERICLAAPTGKAQARMLEALREELEKLNIPQERKNALGNVRCSTVHRLLEYSEKSGFRRNSENRLECDLLVVDECSMLSFDLLGQLFRALHKEAAVILLGDHAQLASVQPGQVFADLCAMLKEYPGHLAKLSESKRFPPDKGIARLRDCLEPHLLSPGAEAWNCLQANHEQLAYKPLPKIAELEKFLAENLNGWRCDGRPFFEAETLDEAWERFEAMRILTPSAQGDYGTGALNEHICNIFDLKDDSPGLPLLQRQNDYNFNIFNGDIGLTWYADENRQPLPRSQADRKSKRLVFFSRGNGEWYGIERELLSNVETAFAMTVHKAQGSGYGKVLFILPELGFAEKLLTRELIYTAVTRGKPEAVVVTTQQVFCAAAERHTERVSGLLE